MGKGTNSAAGLMEEIKMENVPPQEETSPEPEPNPEASPAEAPEEAPEEEAEEEA